MQKKTLLLLGLIIALLLDWVSKYYFDHTLELGQSIPVLGENFFKFTLVYNTGISFSIGAGFDSARFLFGAFASIVGISFVLVALRSYQQSTQTRLDFYLSLSYILIGAGGLGNGLERLATGHVVDFFHFTFGTWSFAIFNVADIWINIGVAAMLVLNLIEYLRSKKQTTNSTNK